VADFKAEFRAVVRCHDRPESSQPATEGLAYAHLAQLFWRLAKTLATDSAPLPEQPLQWGPKKNSRRAYRAICQIPLDITKEGSTAGCACSAAIISAWRRRSTCTGWSFARWCDAAKPRSGGDRKHRFTEVRT
jgi:hypothetical protein